jgi:hypothetical protein
MDDIPETRSAAPMPRGAAPLNEDQVFRDIIGRIGRLPEGVRRVEYRLGEDSVGAPAVWFTFISRDDLNPSEEKMDEFQRIGDVVRDEVMRSDSNRWPFIEIVTE